MLPRVDLYIVAKMGEFYSHQLTSTTCARMMELQNIRVHCLLFVYLFTFFCAVRKTSNPLVLCSEKIPMGALYFKVDNKIVSVHWFATAWYRLQECT